MERLVYTKYSTDRDKRFAIRTDRTIEESGREAIKKVALFDEGISHLEHMVLASNKLGERYKDEIKIAKSTLEGNVLSNEFVAGKSYYHKYDELLLDKDIDGLKEEFEKYKSKIYYSGNELEEFIVTPDFVKVFGEHKELETRKFMSTDVTDIDMIFENIIVSESGQWQLIDYEWTFDFPIPQEYMLFRTMWYLYNNTPINELIPWHETASWIGIKPEIDMCFRSMEQHFQSYVVGDAITLEQSIDKKGMSRASLDELIYKEGLYDEAEWYMNKSRALLKENKKLYNDTVGYRELAEKRMNEYNALKDTYVIQQEELTRIKEGKAYKIANFVNKVGNKMSRGN